jgi:hypothetical protein
VDEWQVEMQQIERNIAGLRARQGDPVIIAELEAELRILQSLYGTSLDVFEAGQVDPGVRQAFAAQHLGDWTYGNVYSYVYDRAMEIELGRRELSSLVPETDFVALIRQGA